MKRKGKGAPAYVDDTPSNADAPRRWNDYTVHFEFPDPSDVGNSLIQLIDVDFKYPGRDDFGLQVRAGLSSTPSASYQAFLEVCCMCHVTD